MTDGEPGSQHRSAALAVGALLLIALGLVLVGDWGSYSADNKLELYWNPRGGLERMFSAWRDGTGAGGPTTGFSPATYFFTFVARGAFAPPWLAQRLLHAFLLFFGATGVMFVARRFTEKGWSGPFIAGLLYMTAPFTVAFLRPSWLFLHASLAPWLLLAFVYGVTTPSLWRWAALFAVLIGAAGSLNPPALIWALVPLVPAGVYLLYVHRDTTPRHVAAWAWRAGLLAVVVSLPALYTITLGLSSRGENLAKSESAAAVAQSSSWSESLRGLGSWILYWNPRGQLVLPFLASYFTSWVTVVASFALPVAAFAVVALLRWRPRLRFGTIVLLSALAMVGSYPIANPSPYGALVAWAFRTIPGAFAMRNSFKAGPGMLMGLSVLAGYGAATLIARLGDRAVAKVGVLIGLVATVAVLSAPLWTGDFYARNGSFQDIPDYWDEAIEWLDEQPGDTGVIVAPGVLSAMYRWGAPGSEILPTFLDRRVFVQQPLSNSPRSAANLVRHTVDMLSSGTYETGSFSPIARRLGIGWIVIRNDLEWERSGAVRPALHDALRNDPNLELVAEFGQPGENVVRPGDETPHASRERSLPPVEVYAVPGALEGAQVRDPAPATLVSGDGAAWPGLSLLGLLDSGPVVYTGELGVSELKDHLRNGATMVMTDSNRRHKQSFRPERQQTLPEIVSRRVSDLFGVEGSQSVAEFGDAVRIHEIGAPNLQPPGNENRSAAAFDGDVRTAWLTGAGGDLAGQGIEVVLAEPTEIDSITVKDSGRSPVTRTVLEVALNLPDGRSIEVPVVHGEGTVDFAPTTVETFSVEVTSLSGGGIAPFGLAEISVPGLDMSEVIRLPTDTVDRAREDSELAELVAAAPLIVSFDRLRSASPDDPERGVRRAFETLVGRDLIGEGSAALGPDAPDELIASLVASPVTAVASERLFGRLEGSGVFAADGDDTTGWLAPTTGNAHLSVRFPGELVTSVEVVLDANDAYAIPATLDISVGGAAPVTVEVPDPTCESDAPICHIDMSVPVPASLADTVDITLGPPAPGTSELDASRLLEVTVNGSPNSPLPAQAPTSCHFGLVSLDGQDPGLRFEGSLDALLAGEAVDVSFCNHAHVGRGRHDFESEPAILLDRLALRSIGSLNGTPIAAATAPVLDSGRGGARLGVDGPAGSTVVSGQADHPGWVATANGEQLRSAGAADTFGSWTIEADTPLEVQLEFTPQRRLTQFILVGALGVVVALCLFVIDPTSKRFSSTTLDDSPIRSQVAYVCTAGFCFLAAGFVGLAVSAGCIWAAGRSSLLRRAIALVAVALVALAALATVPPLGPDLVPLDPLWAARRDLANSFAKLGAVVLASIIGIAVVHGDFQWRSSRRATSGIYDRVRGREDRVGRDTPDQKASDEMAEL